MRYLVTARVKPGQEQALAQAIERGTLGAGSIAGGEYRRNMESARRIRDGSVKWVEVCYCDTPLDEERPVLGGILRPHQGAGRACPLEVQESQRGGTLGLLRLRLHGQAGVAAGHLGTVVLGNSVRKKEEGRRKRDASVLYSLCLLPFSFRES